MSATLRHDAFVYDSDDAFVERMVPFVEEGLAEDAVVVAVTSASNLSMLRAALGSDAGRVSYTDRDEFYVRPATAIASYDAVLRESLAAGASSVRVVGEVQFGPTPAEWREWTAYEAIVNRAFEDDPAWIVCMYDERALPRRVVEDARRTHPQLLGEGREPSPDFHDPESLVRELARAHDALPDLRPISLGGDELAVREQLGAELAAARLPESRTLDLLLAANEILANAWRYASGPELVRVGWVGGQFVCEISDGGPGYDDPLAGYLPPKPGREGAGLWIARQLTTRLELLSTGRGLTVRLWS